LRSRVEIAEPLAEWVEVATEAHHAMRAWRQRRRIALLHGDEHPGERQHHHGGGRA